MVPFGAEYLLPTLRGCQDREGLSVPPPKPRKISSQSNVGGERTQQEAPEQPGAPLAEHHSTTIRGGDGGAVEARQQEPPSVLRGDVQLGTLMGRRLDWDQV